MPQPCTRSRLKTGCGRDRKGGSASAARNGMFWAIILTFVMTVLAMLVLFLRDGNMKQAKENHRLHSENDDLKRQISGYYDQDQRRRERSAYDRGLYDGRQTDALYRNVLKRYSVREQADVMMNGEEAKQ